MNSRKTLLYMRYFAAFALLSTGALLTGCSGNGSGIPGSMGGPTAENPVNGVTQTGGGGGSGGGSNIAVGESCQGGDASHLCLALHFVTYTQNAAPTATQGQAATIIHTVNTLWSQCDIGFQIENYDPEDPTQFGLSYGAQSQNELDQIRTQFQQPTDELLAVTTGPWGTAVNAWTNMPGDGIYGSILEASIVTYGNGIIYAHELGHYLGLDHVSDTSNLMNPVIYTTSTALTSSQCQTAQSTAQSYWSAMLR